MLAGIIVGVGLCLAVAFCAVATLYQQRAHAHVPPPIPYDRNDKL